MRKIQFKDPHRQRHFDFFNHMNHPHFSICANIEITQFLQKQKSLNWPFTIAMVYKITKAANAIPQFRQRIRAGEVVEHDAIHPSFTVTTKKSDVFSFCEVKFHDDFEIFLAEAKKKMALMQEEPSFEDEPGRDDYLFLSAMPWIRFTSLTHAMHYHPADSVPRITWGKHFEEAGQIKMPLSVQVHHALVDGQHVGAFYKKLEQLLRIES